jgi:hypothetical protein
MNPARAAAPGEGRRVAPDSGSAGAPEAVRSFAGRERMVWRRWAEEPSWVSRARQGMRLAADDLCALTTMGRRKPKAARQRMRPQQGRFGRDGRLPASRI